MHRVQTLYWVKYDRRIQFLKLKSVKDSKTHCTNITQVIIWYTRINSFGYNYKVFFKSSEFLIQTFLKRASTGHTFYHLVQKGATINQLRQGLRDLNVGS